MKLNRCVNMFALVKSSSVFLSWIVALLLTNPQPQVAGPGVKPSMHGEELPFLDICSCYLLLWQCCYTSRVSDDGQA